VAPLLEVRGLVKRFDDKTVLDGIDLVLERGETLVVIGGSGSGKSTLARIIVGLDSPTTGTILLDGKDLGAMSASERATEHHRFAMVFQAHALLDSMSVFDNVAFPLRERTHLSESAIRDRVHAQLAALGIEAAADKLPGQLSGGMAKRVGIARAMVMGPEILVYDEPTSGLDPLTSRVVDELIEDMRERYGVSSIVITHDMATAYGVADRVLLLAGGRIAASGPPAEVFRSGDPDIAPFAAASGVDPSRVSRHSRKTAEEIRAQWEATHTERPPLRDSWIARHLHSRARVAGREPP
jgi:phospholipid/cholesterol/gamma-HCH transport system ATP-binding protein